MTRCVATALVTLLMGLALPVCAASLDGVAVRAGNLERYPDIDATSVTGFVEPDEPTELPWIGGKLHYQVGVLRLPNGDNGDALYGFQVVPSARFRPDILPSWSYLELGVGVTYLSGRHIKDRDLGSRGHFVSHALLGVDLTSQWHAGVRIRHTSNADFASPNPGFNAYQLEVGYRFGGN